MSKKTSVEGNVHYEPSLLGRGSDGNFDLGWEGTLLNVTPYDLTLAGSFAVAAPLPAKMVAVRIKSGGPVVLAVSGPAGSGQSVTVDDRFLLVSKTNPLTAVSVSGTAEVELLVGA